MELAYQICNYSSTTLPPSLNLVCSYPQLLTCLLSHLLCPLHCNLFQINSSCSHFYFLLSLIILCSFIINLTTRYFSFLYFLYLLQKIIFLRLFYHLICCSDSLLITLTLSTISLTSLVATLSKLSVYLSSHALIMALSLELNSCSVKSVYLDFHNQIIDGNHCSNQTQIEQVYLLIIMVFHLLSL